MAAISWECFAARISPVTQPIQLTRLLNVWVLPYRGIWILFSLQRLRAELSRYWKSATDFTIRRISIDDMFPRRLDASTWFTLGNCQCPPTLHSSSLLSGARDTLKALQATSGLLKCLISGTGVSFLARRMIYNDTRAIGKPFQEHLAGTKLDKLNPLSVFSTLAYWFGLSAAHRVVGLSLSSTLKCLLASKQAVVYV